MVWMGVKELAQKVAHAHPVAEYSKIMLGVLIRICESIPSFSIWLWLYIKTVSFFSFSSLLYVIIWQQQHSSVSKNHAMQ